MNWEIEKLYDIYNDVKDKSKSSFIPKVRKDDVVTIKYEYNNISRNIHLFLGK